MSPARSRLGRLLAAVLLIPGLFLAWQRCQMRQEIESRDRAIETVMDLEEIRRLSREEGVPLPHLLRQICARGISSIGISEDTLDSLASDGRLLLWSGHELDRELTRNASLAADIAGFVPRRSPGPGSIWAFSRDISLIDRIQRHIEEKASRAACERSGALMLLIHRSGADFRGRFGLGFSPDTLKQAKDADLGLVLRPYNVPRLGSETIHRLFSEFPHHEQVSALLFADEEVLGHRGALPTVAAELRRNPFRLGVVEFLDQAGMSDLLGFLGHSAPIVRVHSIGRKELDENYTPDRAVARWRRAVRERRLKMLYVRCFFENRKRLAGDLLTGNLRYVDDLVAGLRAEGFGIARSQADRQTEPRRNIPGMSGFAGLALGQSLMLGLALLWTISRHRPFSPGLGLSTIGISVFLFLVLSKRLFIATTALAGAVGYATVGCIWAVTALEDRLARNNGLKPVDLVRFLLRLAVPAVIGGVLIAGLHTESEYLLKFEQFRGIKLAFLLPLLWVGVWAFRRYGTGCVSLLFRQPTWLEFGIGALLVLGVGLYLLRSGNVTLFKPSETEDLIRTWFEDAFTARPRNKEFLIGWPAAVFFLFARLQGVTAVLPVLLLLIQMGQVSILNTFCHFHSPLFLAFLRGFHGLWLGISLGLAVGIGVLVLRFLHGSLSKRKHGVLIGYFGFGNLGDELLWRVFAGRMREARPDFEWHLLHQARSLPEKELPPGVHHLPRANLFGLLDTLASAQVVVIPGGGVLQASTSPLSLLYYLSLLLFAKAFGARLLLPSQGLGPWAPAKPAFWPDLFSPILGVVTRLMLEFVDHLSGRDQSTCKAFLGLAFPELPMTTTGDLVFALNDHSQRSSSEVTLDNPLRPLRIGVVLRGGHPDALHLATLLQSPFHPDRPVQIIPLSLQPRSDEEIWKSFSHLPAPVQLSAEHPIPGVLTSLDLVISMRLHACILATLAGVPWIAVAIDPKIAHLAADAGMPCLDAGTSISAETLLPAIQGLLARPDLAAALAAFARNQGELATATLKECSRQIP